MIITIKSERGSLLHLFQELVNLLLEFWSLVFFLGLLQGQSDLFGEESSGLLLDQLLALVIKRREVIVYMTMFDP